MKITCYKCGKPSESKRWIRDCGWEKNTIRCPECAQWIDLDELFTDKWDEGARDVLMNSFPFNVQSSIRSMKK